MNEGIAVRIQDSGTGQSEEISPTKNARWVVLLVHTTVIVVLPWNGR
jgi:hypothetical protein